MTHLVNPTGIKHKMAGYNNSNSVDIKQNLFKDYEQAQANRKIMQQHLHRRQIGQVDGAH
jgi:FMN-dependent NADH-azoreductase